MESRLKILAGLFLLYSYYGPAWFILMQQLCILFSEHYKHLCVCHRVSIPRSTLLPSYKYKAHRRCSFDPSDSLGLPSVSFCILTPEMSVFIYTCTPKYLIRIAFFCQALRWESCFCMIVRKCKCFRETVLTWFFASFIHCKTDKNTDNHASFGSTVCLGGPIPPWTLALWWAVWIYGGPWQYQQPGQPCPLQTINWWDAVIVKELLTRCFPFDIVNLLVITLIVTARKSSSVRTVLFW